MDTKSQMLPEEVVPTFLDAYDKNDLDGAMARLADVFVRLGEGTKGVKVKNKAFRISERLRGCVPAFVLALTCVAVTGTAFARTVYDGDWSVLIATNSGPCGPTYRYGVQISDGLVIYDGGMVSLQGRVTPKGAVRVIVRSSGQSANGYGRLTKNRGGGVWKGQGTGGTCAGTWVAERRG
jgi:hypothetical protein